MSSKRILIVDDDMLIRRILVEWFQFLCPQHEIVEAASGPEALGRLGIHNGTRSFELILIDDRMPVMSGLALARIIRQGWPNVPVVLMTDYTYNSHLRKEVDALKLEGLLEKPFSYDQLKEFLPHPDEDQSER